MIVAIQQNNGTRFPPGVSDLASHDWGAGQLMIPDKSPIFWSELKVQPESSNVHATIALAGIPGQPLQRTGFTTRLMSVSPNSMYRTFQNHKRQPIGILHHQYQLDFFISCDSSTWCPQKQGLIIKYWRVTKSLQWFWGDCETLPTK